MNVLAKCARTTWPVGAKLVTTAVVVAVVVVAVVEVAAAAAAAVGEVGTLWGGEAEDLPPCNRLVEEDHHP